MRVVSTEAFTPPESLLAAQDHRTLEAVVRWVAPLGGDIVDIVVQDEFTHDVVVRVSGAWLVYDTT